MPQKTQLRQRCPDFSDVRRFFLSSLAAFACVGIAGSRALGMKDDSSVEKLSYRYIYVIYMRKTCQALLLDKTFRQKIKGDVVI